jgi:aryl-alcohol dehydrogenase-like predicted oxidoreductase
MNDHIFGDLAAKDQNWDTLDVVREIAESVDATPAAVSLSWLANRPGVAASIIGARTLKQLEGNLTAAELVLDEKATARLDEASAHTSNDYPYGPFGVKQRDRYVDSSDQAITELF